MKPYQQIFFDFDSTLVRAETLDLLAHMAGVGEEVLVLTELSMNGEVPLEQVFEKKIKMIAPSREMIARLHQESAFFVEGIKEVISNLHQLGKEVYILTSNFRQLVEPFAQQLGIPFQRIIASELYFDDDGFYRGMSSGSPLARSGGKRVMIEQHVREKDEAVMIGDSVTDLACAPCVHRFICFGGVVAREPVRAQADIFVESSDARALLPHLLTPEELAG